MLTLQCDSDVSKSLQWLRGSGELCDLVLVGHSGQQAVAHSCVVAAHSTVIAAVLQGRLSAQRDWSVLHPLIVSIDSGDMTVAQEKGSEVNLVEAVVGLVYGEPVSVWPHHLAPLRQLATLLGLSHHITSCLHSGKQQPDPTTKLAAPRKKQRRKTSLVKTLDKKESHHKETEQLTSNINMVHDVLSDQYQLSEVLRSTEAQDYPMPDSLEVTKDNCGSSLIELSIYCSGVQDLTTAASATWTLDDCHSEALDFEPAIQTQGAGLPHCSTDTPPSGSSAAHLTDEAKNTKVQIKAESELETGTHVGSEAPGDTILSLQAASDEPSALYFVENQQQLQQKKQQKVKSLGKGLLCTVCGSSFQRCGDMVKHVQNLQHFTVECPLCFVQVRDREGQRLHFALHDQQLPFFCAYCDLRFRTRAALTMHTPKHSTTKPFVCSECGRGFKWRHSLQAHLYTHSPTNHLLCDICGFSSKYVSSFKAHLVQHSGRTFPCPKPGCAFTSSRKTHLNDHLATHSKTRVHQCEVCGYSFSHSKNMRRHMRLHAPASNRLACSAVSKLHCSFRTTRPDKLRNHLSKKHNITYVIPSDSLPKVLSSLPPSGDITEPNMTETHHLSDNGSLDVASASELKTHTHNYASESTEEGGYSHNHGKAECMTAMGSDKTSFPDACEMTGAKLSHSEQEAEQQALTALVSAPHIVQLSDIQSLHTSPTETDKQQMEVTDAFSTGFLEDHELLLAKPDGASTSHAQHLQSEASASTLQSLTQPSSKISFSTGDSMQSQDELSFEAVSYSSQCSFSRPEDSVVLEVMPPMGGMSKREEDMALMDHDALEKKSDKQAQCMESLSILDFMLENVTD